ncbi:hypothetical protein GCM10010279_67020 [Streptomyces mutabilis]|nr:hypothetical protein GCM10010279_67020 [Streptomyces mutabilis]
MVTFALALAKPQNGTSDSVHSRDGVRRYRSRAAPWGRAAEPGCGLNHTLLVRVRHGRHHPRLRAVGAAYGLHLDHGAAREAASATKGSGPQPLHDLDRERIHAFAGHSVEGEALVTP